MSLIPVILMANSYREYGRMRYFICIIALFVVIAGGLNTMQSNSKIFYVCSDIKLILIVDQVLA